jgi:hypothetical protein
MPWLDAPRCETGNFLVLTCRVATLKWVLLMWLAIWLSEAAQLRCNWGTLEDDRPLVRGIDPLVSSNEAFSGFLAAGFPSG